MGEKEKHIEHYPNGKKKKEGTFKDGKADGLFTNWYESGQTSFKGTYIDGKKDGLFTWWYVNGKKEYEGTYKNGRKISVKEWNEDGSVKQYPHPKDLSKSPAVAGFFVYKRDAHIVGLFFVIFVKY